MATKSTENISEEPLISLWAMQEERRFPQFIWRCSTELKHDYKALVSLQGVNAPSKIVQKKSHLKKK